jgi:diguanylate cyclase (GGDEF)-like protein
VSTAVVAAIAWHHGGPSGVASPVPEVACVQIGDQVVHMVGGQEPDHVLLEVALERAGMPASALDALATHTLPASRPTPVAEDDGSLARRVTDVEDLERTDELTSVDNRRHWLHAVRDELTQPGGARGAVLLCDVDGLDVVNSTHGRSVGDAVLAEIAEILTAHGRTGRLAGDEFAVWLPGADAADAAAEIADQVRIAFTDRAGAPRVDVCIGFADAATHGTDLAGVLEAAALALRSAKHAGPGNTAAAFAPAA